MSTPAAIRHLHTDLTKLHQARRTENVAQHQLGKDRKALEQDRREGDRDHKALKKDSRSLDTELKAKARVVDAMAKAVGDLDARKQALQAQLAADTFDYDPVTPGVQQNPALLQRLADLTQHRMDVAQNFNTRIDAAKASIDQLRTEKLDDRSAIKADRKAIRQDVHEIRGDKKEVKHDHAVRLHARHAALHDLRPAEYKMGLKGTNRARKDLGLNAVHQLIRPTHGSQKLANAARAAAMGLGGYTSLGLCATGVSRAIASAFGISVSGNGNQIDNNLPRSKFREVHISLAQALKIPGCVLTWEHTSTAAGSIYGHTAITLGDGHSSASDFIENNTLAGAQSRTGLKIFMPR